MNGDRIVRIEGDGFSNCNDSEGICGNCFMIGLNSLIFTSIKGTFSCVMKNGKIVVAHGLERYVWHIMMVCSSVEYGIYYIESLKIIFLSFKGTAPVVWFYDKNATQVRCLIGKK